MFHRIVSDEPRSLAFSFIFPCSIGCCTADLCNFRTRCSIYCRSAGGVPALEAPLAKSHRCTTPAVEAWSFAMCSPAMPNPSIEQYELEYDPNSNCAQIRFMYVLAESKASIGAICSLHQTLPMEMSVGTCFIWNLGEVYVQTYSDNPEDPLVT